MEQRLQRCLESEEKSSRYQTRPRKVKVIIIMKLRASCLKSGAENRLETDTEPMQWA